MTHGLMHTWSVRITKSISMSNFTKPSQFNASLFLLMAAGSHLELLHFNRVNIVPPAV